MYSPYSSQISSSFSMLLNCILYILTLHFTSKQMQSYARIIRLHCILDGLICLKVFMSLNHAMIVDGNLYMMMFSPFYFRFPRATLFLMYSYPWGICYLISIVPIDFTYRYLTVCKQKTLTVLQLTGIVLFVLLITFIETLPFAFFTKQGPSKDTVEEAQALFEFVGWRTFEEVPPFIVIPTKHPYTLLAMFILFTTIAFNYTVIVFTVRKINKAANNNSTSKRNSTMSRKANKHILRVLIIQAVIPAIVFVPVVFILIQELTSIDTYTLSDISITFGVWYTPFKCLATIMVIPTYRRAFLWPVTFFLTKKQSVQEVETVDRTE